MTSFEVHFKSHDTIEAEDLTEAKLKFKEKYPAPHVEPLTFYDLNDSNKEYEVIGCCEICELAIIAGESYVIDGSVMEHLECHDESNK